MKTRLSLDRVRFTICLAVPLCLFGIGGCGSKTASPAENALAADPQKAAAAGQQGAAASAAEQQARRADEARRATQKR